MHAHVESPSRKLSPLEAAVELGVSRSLVYKLIHAGELPFVALGKRLVIERAELDRFLERVRYGAESAARKRAERCSL